MLYRHLVWRENLTAARLFGKGRVYLINVSDISMAFSENKVLSNVSFLLDKKECACIIGRNGCGKSTLLNILASMQKPDSGFFDLAGASVGYAPQSDILFPDLSVGDNLKFWASAAGIDHKSIWQGECIQTLEIADFKKKKVKHLSGGMRRRVSVAIAIIKNPEIIILDEPFAGLDVFFKANLMEFLRKLKGLGKTIIYTCHSTDETTGLADKIFLIENGSVTFSGGKSDIAKLFEKMQTGVSFTR